ncbi:MAG: hypothetical protein LBT40_04900 [Deltaproteobacteria bacterium]|jgi:hypothetical protein|nr:hypothetical protein [Deltaproteobacteria bacterium]
MQVDLISVKRNGNCSGAPPLRAFSEEESPDEAPLKLKSQQWILHMEGKSFYGGLFG